jgi:hypothetical protein
LARKSTAEVFSSVREFKNLPFNDIYHDRTFQPEEKDRIIDARQAEVVIPGEVDLQHLKFICCRSSAEAETLAWLLDTRQPDSSLWQQWQKQIIVQDDSTVFFHKWAYLSEVILENSRMVFIFHNCEDQHDAGPFSVRVDISDRSTGQNYTMETTITTQNPLEVTLTPDHLFREYEVKLHLDNALAYAGTYDDDFPEDDNPF